MKATYYAKNKERILAQQKLRREANKEASREYQRSYYLKHREKYKTPEYRARAKATKKAKYYSTPPEVRAQRSRDYYLRNKEASKRRAQEWALQNKSRKVENMKRWLSENREHIRLSSARYENQRRARLKDSKSPGVTAREWAEILEINGHVCVYCGGSNNGKRLERDHIHPIALGGLDEPSNVVPACRSCNASKHTKTVTEWRAHQEAARKFLAK